MTNTDFATRFNYFKTPEKFDVIQELKNVLNFKVDGELIEIYDGCVCEKDGKLIIDGFVYKIIHGYFTDMPETTAKVNKVITDWAKSKGGRYFEYETSSVLVPAGME